MWRGVAGGGHLAPRLLRALLLPGGRLRLGPPLHLLPSLRVARGLLQHLRREMVGDCTGDCRQIARVTAGADRRADCGETVGVLFAEGATRAVASTKVQAW